MAVSEVTTFASTLSSLVAEPDVVSPDAAKGIADALGNAVALFSAGVEPSDDVVSSLLDATDSLFNVVGT